jgi:hypothetical protein
MSEERSIKHEDEDEAVEQKKRKADVSVSLSSASGSLPGVKTSDGIAWGNQSCSIYF